MATKKAKSKQPKISKEETIGYHKGSLTVLAKEREELSRILGIVDQLIQMHIAALKEMGVDLEKEASALALGAAPVVAGMTGKSPGKPKKKPPIEDVI